MRQLNSSMQSCQHYHLAITIIISQKLSIGNCITLLAMRRAGRRLSQNFEEGVFEFFNGGEAFEALVDDAFGIDDE